MMSSTVDAMYRAAGFDFTTITSGDLADVCRRYAALPLMFQPGSAWGYSVATDVIGRLVEVISGQSLADFVADRIFEPLGMDDARWWVDDADADRLAGLYVPHPVSGAATHFAAMADQARSKPEMYNGGAGLICTAADYQRFTQMLLGEGTLDGVRILGSRTLRYMTRNHLPSGGDVASMQTGGFAETTFEGVGFGLGFAVVLDPVPARVPGSVGSYYWGGAASTAFWVDPAEELAVEFYTQLIPSATYPIRPQLRQLVYSALR
jgi:CubicO group peptidase (beta-lactamase class C family)